MAPFNSLFALTALSISSVLAHPDYILAKRVDVSSLSARISFIGGWALGGGITDCPSNTTSCGDNDPGGNWPGTCCPSSSTCAGQGLGEGMACCPGKSECGESIVSIPTCADPSWNLYTGIRKYFCCEPGKIGVFPRSGLNDLVGLCVPSDQAVPASNLATLVSSLAPAASSSEVASTVTTTAAAPATTTKAGAGPTSAATSPSPSPSPKSNIGAANAASLAGLCSGVLVSLVLALL